jgi:cobalamin biosynthesis Mg chelatase CobN
MNTFATIHTKFQGETMFCFVFIATFFGYILGVNKVIECVVAKHSSNNGIMCNKYTQTNLNDLVEYLASNNIVSEKYSNKRRRDTNHEVGDKEEEEETDVVNETTNNDDANNENENGKENVEDAKENKNVEHANKVHSPQSDGCGTHSSSNSNSEEDYEVVKKSENVRTSKNKIKFFEWFSIL